MDATFYMSMHARLIKENYWKCKDKRNFYLIQEKIYNTEKLKIY